jgi:hypothetical protein
VSAGSVITTPVTNTSASLARTQSLPAPNPPPCLPPWPSPAARWTRPFNKPLTQTLTLPIPAGCARSWRSCSSPCCPAGACCPPTPPPRPAVAARTRARRRRGRSPRSSGPRPLRPGWTSRCVWCHVCCRPRVAGEVGRGGAAGLVALAPKNGLHCTQPHTTQHCPMCVPPSSLLCATHLVPQLTGTLVHATVNPHHARLTQSRPHLFGLLDHTLITLASQGFHSERQFFIVKPAAGAGARDVIPVCGAAAAGAAAAALVQKEAERQASVCLPACLLPFAAAGKRITKTVPAKLLPRSCACCCVWSVTASVLLVHADCACIDSVSRMGCSCPDRRCAVLAPSRRANRH